MNGQAKRLKPMPAYGLMTARFHTLLIRFQLAFPLSQARTPWTRQARLRSPNACVRAHDRSLPHLVIIGFRLTAPLSQAPSLGQDELTRRKCNLDTRGLTVRLHTLHNRAQTSNKAHDKFVPRRDCACADHSRPSLSTALLGGWSSHLVNRVSPHNPLVPSTLAWARRAYPSQARLGYAGADRSAPHLVIIMFQLAFPLS